MLSVIGTLHFDKTTQAVSKVCQLSLSRLQTACRRLLDRPFEGRLGLRRKHSSPFQRACSFSFSRLQTLPRRITLSTKTLEALFNGLAYFLSAVFRRLPRRVTRPAL